MKLSANKFTQALSHYLRRYHVMMYTLTVIIGVAVAMFFLNNILQQSSTIEAEQQPPMTTFNPQAIEQLNEFSTREDLTDKRELPEGRINPFAE